MADNEKKEAQLPEGGDDKAKDKSQPKPKKEKVSIFKRLGKFLRECRSELKKVVWFGREQTFNSSVLVLAGILIVGIIVAALDFGFSKCLFWLADLV